MTAFTHLHELAVGLDERLEILGACGAQSRQPRLIQLLAVLLPVRQLCPPRVSFSGSAERDQGSRACQLCRVVLDFSPFLVILGRTPFFFDIP